MDILQRLPAELFNKILVMRPKHPTAVIIDNVRRELIDQLCWGRSYDDVIKNAVYHAFDLHDEYITRVKITGVSIPKFTKSSFFVYLTSRYDI